MTPRRIVTVLMLAAATAFGGLAGCGDAPSNPLRDSGALARRGGGNADNNSDCRQYNHATGCTRTHGYWKNHLSWPCPYTPGAPICASTQITFIEGMTTPPNGNAYWILSQQYVPALLNKTANRGNIPAYIQDLIDEARLWFAGRDPNAAMTDAERTRAIEMAGIFDDFNNGLGGLPHCD